MRLIMFHVTILAGKFLPQTNAVVMQEAAVQVIVFAVHPHLFKAIIILTMNMSVIAVNGNTQEDVVV